MNKTMPNPSLAKLGRWAQLPILTAFFSSLLGVGFDSKREKSLNKALIISTLFLQLGSGYTTWLGLCQYVPGIVAFLIALAIQGLLFASSWRLGASMYSRNFKFSLLAIYVISMVTSVFFSYSALLDRVYTLERRDADQLQRVRLASDVIMTDLNQQLDASLRATATACRRSLVSWHDAVNSTVNTSLVQLRTLNRQYELEHDRMVAKSTQETNTGGTIVIINGQKFITPKGHGPFAKDYESQAFSLLYDKLNPVRGDLTAKERSLGQFNSFIGTLLSSDSALTPENLTALSSAWTSLATSFSGDKAGIPSLPPMPVGLREKTFEHWQIATARRSTDMGAAILSASTVPEIKNAAYSYLSGLTFLDANRRRHIFGQIENLGRYEGSRAHPFVLAIGEFQGVNPLAIGSLLVAIAIDILVLCCGLMVARPDSYLDMKNPDDLFDIQESAVETVLSLDLERAESLHHPDPFVRRAISILKRSRPDVAYAYKGLPAILTPEDIMDLNLGKEIGVLFALELARELPDRRVGIRTRLILWLADQIWRSTENVLTTEDLKKSFAQMETP